MAPPLLLLFLPPNCRQYPEEEIQMTNTRKCPTSLIIKEMKIKTIYYFRPMMLERTEHGSTAYTAMKV